MSADETDEYSTYREFYHYYKAVIITFDIKYIVLVANIVSSGKILTNLRKIMPLSLLGDVIPPFQSYSRISVSGRFIEFLDLSM